METLKIQSQDEIQVLINEVNELKAKALLAVEAMPEGDDKDHFSGVWDTEAAFYLRTANLFAKTINDAPSDEYAHVIVGYHRSFRFNIESAVNSYNKILNA